VNLCQNVATKHLNYKKFACNKNISDLFFIFARPFLGTYIPTSDKMILGVSSVAFTTTTTAVV
jgi:hypothetical protein